MKKKILIVDDNEGMRRLVRLSLRHLGCQLYEAEEGHIALEAIKVFRPDIVILDVMMPGELNGYQVCKKIKQSRTSQAIYVILVTAQGQKASIEEGKRVQADAYLVKPFSPSELSRIVAGVKLKSEH